MGLQPNKYHISDDGNVYRVNEDGSFSEVGNVQDLHASSAKEENMEPVAETILGDSEFSLYKLEQRILSGKGCSLSVAERKFVAANSLNVDALERFITFAGSQMVCTLIRRFEKGELNLDPVMTSICFNCKSTVTLERLAKCRRPFSNPIVFKTLSEHSMPYVRVEAVKNPNNPYANEKSHKQIKTGNVANAHKSDSPGCIGSIFKICLKAAIAIAIAVWVIDRLKHL